MAEILNQNKENIRRFIKRNNINEINEDRPHPNSPKFYDEKTFKILKNEYMKSEEEKKDNYNSSTTEAHESTTKAQHPYNSDKDEVVQLLKVQIERLEKDKEQLKDHQSKLTQMLEQQQHLTLIAQKQAETLSIELNEAKEVHEEKEVYNHDSVENENSFFKKIFKRKK